MDEDGVEMVREVTDEEVERDRAAIRGMWELAVVFQFFQTFQSPLAITSIPVKMSDIEQAIVKSNGQGLLARLHTVATQKGWITSQAARCHVMQDLLKGLRPRVGVDETNWTAVLARKLRSECPNSKENPFNPERGSEALDYCNAPAVQRSHHQTGETTPMRPCSLQSAGSQVPLRHALLRERCP